MAVFLDIGAAGKEAKVAQIRAKISQIEQVIAGLNGVSTSVEDVLGGDEAIAGSYHLAGAKYESLTTQENDIRTTAQTGFSTKKTTVIEQLEAKKRALIAEQEAL